MIRWENNANSTTYTYDGLDRLKEENPPGIIIPDIHMTSLVTEQQRNIMTRLW